MVGKCTDFEQYVADEVQRKRCQVLISSYRVLAHCPFHLNTAETQDSLIPRSSVSPSRRALATFRTVSFRATLGRIRHPKLLTIAPVQERKQVENHKPRKQFDIQLPQQRLLVDAARL